MKGHLYLECARGETGASYLRRQSFRAPLHLSKPHEDAGALVVNLVNPTAGIFDDDEIEVHVSVDEGASLVLTTPAASRVFRSRNGTYANLKQTLEVGPGAFLEYFPEPFIPHAGARYRQQNILRIAEGGSLLYFEWLAPGRTARGEVFLFDQLCWDTDVEYGSQLVARERYTLSPEGHSLDSLRLCSPEAHYIGCFVIGLPKFPQEPVEALGSDAVYLGWAPLQAAGWAIKAVCADSLHARRTIKALREVLYAAKGGSPPALGRF